MHDIPDRCWPRSLATFCYKTPLRLPQLRAVGLRPAIVDAASAFPLPEIANDSKQLPNVNTPVLAASIVQPHRQRLPLPFPGSAFLFHVHLTLDSLRTARTYHQLPRRCFQSARNHEWI